MGAGILATILIPALPGAFGGSSTLSRDLEPVLLAGEDLPALLGRTPGEIVAFRFDGGAGAGWTQVPLQVDERHVVDFGVVYDAGPVGITTLAYSDPATFAGPDPDPALDADDELCFMAADAGARAAGGLPAGILPAPGLELRIADPLDGGVGYVYLFLSGGSLAPGAGADHVDYDFVLLSGGYKETYDTMSGPNPEDSTVVTAAYSTHFSDRWIRDELSISAGAADGSEILDRHKAMFAPGVCTRTEDTFSNGEGAFFANLDGPVRAIRSYMGANSGPLTQRDHFFYEARQVIHTILRVHAIASILDAYDYSPAASGMVYRDSLNPAGVTVDGVPDAVATGLLEWQLVSGAQGSLIHALAFETDISPFDPTSFYSDDITPSFTQCTGDPFEYAMSGPFVDDPIPNTDPALGSAKKLVGIRTLTYEPPGAGVATAALRFQQAQTPLEVRVASYAPRRVHRAPPTRIP